MFDEFTSIVYLEDEAKVKKLLENGKNANVSNSEGKTPMHLAAQIGIFIHQMHSNWVNQYKFTFSRLR